jgi:SAM-dependent methyltransferase
MRGRNLVKLLSASRKEWTYLVYLLRMKARGMDISWVSVADLGLSEERSNWHGASGGPFLDVVLRAQTITRNDSILDIGCGKGGAMLTMLRYPFQRVDGVDLSPRLIEIARRNLARAGAKHSRLFCSDATEFQELDTYSWFYMYNPFPAVVMKPVIGNICDSLIRTGREANIIYNNPVHGQILTDAGFRKVAEFEVGANPCVVYRAVPPHPRRRGGNG